MAASAEGRIFEAEREEPGVALSAFTERSRPPTEADLSSTLGTAYALWTELPAALALRIGPMQPVWGFASARLGWSLRVVRKERVILYLTPQRGQFLVSFALGERAVVAARGAALPPATMRVVDAAPRYAEGRGVRFQVKSRRPVTALATLAQIKREH